jgi:glutamate:GABA antiporter
MPATRAPAGAGPPAGVDASAGSGVPVDGAAAAAVGGLRRELRLWDLVLLNVVAITGLRWWLTAAGGYGWSALPLWVAANLLFFVPSALAVIDLTTRFPDQGGIYVWTKRAFGDLHGFICGWTYWTNNLVYFPTLLLFAVANFVFVLGPGRAWLEKNNLFAGVASLVIFWLAVLANLRGLRYGRLVNSIGGFGTWIPAMVLIALGGLTLLRAGAATPFATGAFVPAFSVGTVAFFAQICFAFSGMELGSVMSGEIVDPRRNVPRAILIAGGIITAIYVLGTGALLVAMPREDIGVLNGVGYAIAAVQAKFGLGLLAAACALLIAVGAVGQTSAWVGGASRIPFIAGIDRYLPESFGRLHPRHATPHVAILWMGGISSLLIVMGLAGGPVRDAYLVLANFTIIVYFIPYLYLFASLVRLAVGPPPPGSIPVPGGRPGILAVAVVGFTTTLLACIFALMPPEGTESVWWYETQILGGSALLVFFGFLLYRRGRRLAHGGG